MGLSIKKREIYIKLPHCVTAYCGSLTPLDYCDHKKINQMYNKLKIKDDTILVSTIKQCHAIVVIHVTPLCVFVSLQIKWARKMYHCVYCTFKSEE